MRLFLESDEQERPRIELIPMLDVMFFLMVVFIFLSISLIKLEGVPLDLPKASASRMDPKGKIIHISVMKDGSLFLQKKKVDLPQLEMALKSLPGNQSGHSQIVISGDRSSRLQRLIDVMNLCNRLGFDNLSIQTRDH